MRLWQTLKGDWRLTYPYTTFLSKVDKWGLSYKRFDFVLSDDTTTPYSILHVGPYELFMRPKTREIDWF